MTRPGRRASPWRCSTSRPSPRSRCAGRRARNTRQRPARTGNDGERRLHRASGVIRAPRVDGVMAGLAETGPPWSSSARRSAQAILSDLVMLRRKGPGQRLPRVPSGPAQGRPRLRSSSRSARLAPATCDHGQPQGWPRLGQRCGRDRHAGAVVAVNAVGCATVGDGPHFWAAPMNETASSAGAARRPMSGKTSSPCASRGARAPTPPSRSSRRTP